MARQFIFKDTETGRELVLPVTPGSYDIEHGRKAAGITMQESGDVNLPGPAVLLDTELTCRPRGIPSTSRARGRTRGYTWSSWRSGATRGRCCGSWCPGRR